VTTSKAWFFGDRLASGISLPQHLGVRSQAVIQ